MDENRARRVTDALRDRGINAHLKKSGIDAYAVQVAVTGGREAVWGSEGTTGLEAEVLLDGDLVGFVPQIPVPTRSTRPRSSTRSRAPTTTSPSAGSVPKRPRRPRPCPARAASSAASSTVSATTQKASGTGW
jgi:hypothetical protein